ncbi:MAG: hypothetical protein ABFE01_26490 [Phycisphaerales bacterium]|jgi:hypothetical protein
MRSAATTKMSSKGQVVILKMVRAPSMKDFDRLIAKARAQARAAGLKRADVSAASRRNGNREIR